MAIHVDVIPVLKDRDVQRAADELANRFDTAGAQASNNFSDALAQGLGRAGPKIQKQLNAVENATARVRSAQLDYVEAQNRGNVSSDRMAVLADRIAIARRGEADAHRSVAAALRDHVNAARASDSAMENITASLQRLGTQAFRTSRGLLTIMGPAAIAALYEGGRAVVTASQALALLPAAAVAAAAGIGTLKMATSNFNQAMSNIGDIEKFNEALVSMGPNAAQAALEIRNNVMPVIQQMQRASEDALFAGLADRIESLKTGLAPAMQSMTTSIATAFNQMATGTADTLLDPRNLGTLSLTMSNIGTAFNNAAPAAQLFTQSILDIVNVGSQFLPDLGSSVTGLAGDFSAFITRVSQSGELHTFIQQGIDAAKELGSVILDVGQFAYQTFGGVGRGEIQAWGNQIKDALSTIAVLIEPLNLAFKTLNTEIGDTGAKLSDLINPLSSVIEQINNLRSTADDPKTAAQDKLNAERAKHGLPPVDANGNVPANPFEDPRLKGMFGVDPNAVPDRRPVPGAPTYIGGHLGDQAFPTTANGLPILGAPQAHPGHLPKPHEAPKPSDRERLDAIKAGLDPSLYRVDPNAPIPGMPSAGPLVGGPMPGGGYGAASGQEFFEGQQRIIEQAHTLEEARKDRLALERDNQSTAEQIADAKWKEHESEVALQKAQADLVDKTRGTQREMKQGMDELSAALDPDLGLGKGLSGLADNLVRFVGSLATAPMMAQLGLVKNANEAATGIQGGYGLLGIQGAQNLSQGLSPLLGRPMPTSGGAGLNSPTSTGTAGSATGAGTGTTGSQATPLPGESPRDFAHRVMMPYWQNQGLTVGDHAADQYGEHQKGALDIMVPDIATGQQVLQQVLSDPNVYGAIFNRQSYGYGHGAQGQAYTGDNPHTDHVHAWYKPGDPNNINPSGTGLNTGMPTSGGGGYGLGSGVVPVYVTNMGGGGMGLGGGAPFGSPASGTGAGALPGTSASGIPNPPASAGSEGWRATVGQVFDQYAGKAGLPASAKGAWVDAIVKQISTESGGNPDKTNPNDSNGRGGTQSVAGLLQYLPSSYASSGGALTGLPYMDPVGQIAGALLAPRTAAGLPDTGATGGIGAGHGWGPTMSPTGTATTPTSAGLPAGTGIPVPGGGGQAGGPGPNMPIGAGLTNTTPTPLGGVEPYSNPNGGGIGIDSGAISMAGSAMDMMMPGAGQAAATGMKLAGRAIQYAGQMAGIGVQGLMDTFLPTGGSELANNSWLTRIVGGLAGATPQLPNLAGGKGGQPPGPLTPQQAQQQPGLGGALGNSVNYDVTINNSRDTGDGLVRDFEHHIGQANSPDAVAGHR